MLDIRSVKGKSYGGSKFWILVVYEAKDIKWSFLVKKKNELAEKVIGTIEDAIWMLSPNHSNGQCR